jgi:hypothetical protein
MLGVTHFTHVTHVTHDSILHYEINDYQNTYKFSHVPFVIFTTPRCTKDRYWLTSSHTSSSHNLLLVSARMHNVNVVVSWPTGPLTMVMSWGVTLAQRLRPLPLLLPLQNGVRLCENAHVRCACVGLI